MTADDKYSVISSDNSMQTIQMDLSQKQNVFSLFLSVILESALNFEHFVKKDDPHSLCISEITDPEKRA